MSCVEFLGAFSNTVVLVSTRWGSKSVIHANQKRGCVYWFIIGGQVAIVCLMLVDKHRLELCICIRELPSDVFVCSFIQGPVLLSLLVVVLAWWPQLKQGEEPKEVVRVCCNNLQRQRL